MKDLSNSSLQTVNIVQVPTDHCHKMATSLDDSLLILILALMFRELFPLTDLAFSLPTQLHCFLQNQGKKTRQHKASGSHKA